MPPPSFTFYGIHTQTYTFLMVAGVLFVMVVLMVSVFNRAHPGQIVDCAIGAVVGGLLLARVLHVLLQWQYFALHRNEIMQLSAGGLNWHGAVIGALIGGSVVARIRLQQLQFSTLLDALTPALPLLALLAFWGCAANHCVFGAEVSNLAEHPTWLVWEERDLTNTIAPRYAVQRLGMIFASGLLLMALFMIWRDWLVGRRFWLVLMLLASGMFALGFVRGDYAIMAVGLRGDQWLDVAMLAIGMVMLWRVRQSRH